MNNQELQVPYALNAAGKLVSEQIAERGDDFTCLGCEEAVFLKRGEIRVAHFSHYPESGGTSESIEHKTAKWIIAYMYRFQMDGYFHVNPGGTVQFGTVYTRRRCPNCSKRVFARLTYPYDYNSVHTEYDIGDYTIDVVLCKDSRPVVGVEVRHTHPVPEEKWDGLKAAGFPCIEVESQAIIDNWFHEKRYTKEYGMPWSLPLEPVKQNISIIALDRLHRIFCPDCDPRRPNLFGPNGLPLGAYVMENSLPI